MKKNIEQKYFAKQRARLVLNIVFGALTALGVVFISVINWFLGSWMLVIGIFGLIFTNTGRVTDKDFDSFMKDKFELEDELAVETPDYAAEGYDLTAQHIKRCKDKQIRTNILCQARIYRTKSTLRVVSKRAQMDAEGCEKRELEAPLGEVFLSIEEAREGRTNKVYYTMTVEAADGQSVTFPVTSDYATEQFVDEINARSSFAKERGKRLGKG